MECPGCAATVEPGDSHCSACGRQLPSPPPPRPVSAPPVPPLPPSSFDAPPPPPSDWLPGAPLFGRGSPSDPIVVVTQTRTRTRRNGVGCGCGMVAVVVFFAILGVAIMGVVWVGRSVNEAVGDPFGGGGEDIAGEPLTLDRPVDQHLGEDDNGVHVLSGIEGRVTITVAGGDGFDPVLRVEDAGGGLVGENDDADGLDSRLAVLLSTSDDLRVRVREFSGDAGDYTVTVLRGDDVVGVSPLDAGPIPLRTEVEGEVGRNQAAAYRFTGEGHEVTIDVFGIDDFDPVVRVLDGNGKELGKDDDSGEEGRDSRLSITIPGAAHVTIEVTGYGGDAGRYRIVVG